MYASVRLVVVLRRKQRVLPFGRHSRTYLWPLGPLPRQWLGPLSGAPDELLRPLTWNRNQTARVVRRGRPWLLPCALQNLPRQTTENPTRSATWYRRTSRSTEGTSGGIHFVARATDRVSDPDRAPGLMTPYARRG